MLLFFQAILAGAVVGAVAGLCTIAYDLWMVFVDDEEDDDEPSTRT